MCTLDYMTVQRWVAINYTIEPPYKSQVFNVSAHAPSPLKAARLGLIGMASLKETVGTWETWKTKILGRKLSERDLAGWEILVLSENARS